MVPLTMARLFVLCRENALGSSNSIYMHVRCQEGSSAALLETKLQSTSVGPSCLQVTRLFMESLKQLAIHAQKQTKRLDRAMQAFQPCHKVHEPTKHRFYIVATSCFVGQSAYISLYFSIFLYISPKISIFLYILHIHIHADMMITSWAVRFYPAALQVLWCSMGTGTSAGATLWVGYILGAQAGSSYL